MATIEQVLDPLVPTKSGRDLSLSELQRLTLRRLRGDKHFIPMLMLGVEGVIDRKRALAEVQSLSFIGRHLLQIEQDYIAFEIKLRSQGKWPADHS
jgi:hypothetical protein